MKLQLAENIRKYRKQRHLTQEQLAEAMGVSVGAVSRWESGDTNPDISLLPELAGFFEISTDALMGFSLQSEGQKQGIEEIRMLRNAKHFTEATPLVEQLLLRYPNSFDATVCAAQFFSLYGTETGGKPLLNRGVELFRRALELEGQNTNPRVNAWTLRNDIASVYQRLNQNDRALDELEQNNAAGLNDAQIGMLLADEKRPEKALPYLSDALLYHTSELIYVVSGYVTAYGQQKWYREALEMLDWMQEISRGLMIDGRISFLNMYMAQLETARACFLAELGDMQSATAALRKAKKEALVFDAAPDFGYTETRYFHSNQRPTAFTDFGATAIGGITQMLHDKENPQALVPIWESVLAEA